MAVAVVLIASDAEAKCMMPGVQFEPSTGDVPSTPVLRLFLPKYWAPASPVVTAVDASGKKLTGTLSLESSADAFASYHVALPKAANGKLQVHFVDKNGTDHGATYNVDAAWKKPSIVAPTMTVTRTQSSWTCSHQLTRNIVFPSVASAYRVTFTAMKNGKDTGSVVLPENPRVLFGSSSADASLELGHVNCMGQTYAWAGGRLARVEALLPDGSAVTLARDLWLDPP